MYIPGPAKAAPQVERFAGKCMPHLMPAICTKHASAPVALFAAPSGNNGDAVPDMIDSWDTNESSMMGVRVALVGRALPDMGRPPAEPGLGGLPADAGRDELGLQTHCTTFNAGRYQDNQ